MFYDYYMVNNNIDWMICEWKDREMYSRDDRPNINIGTLGSSQHGKTAMVSAFTRGNDLFSFKRMFLFLT